MGIKSNVITISVLPPKGGPEGYCVKTGTYITIYGTSGTGTAYPYNYSGPGNPLPTLIQPGIPVTPPNFCIYYEGSDAPTGCYCNFGLNPMYASAKEFYTDGVSNWWAQITLNWPAGQLILNIKWVE